MRYESLNGTGTESVQKSTGKHWDEWVDILDNAQMQNVSHKEIASWLWDNYGEHSKQGSLSGWWCQQITVGYEYAHGRRVTGEKADGTFELSVQKRFPLSSEKLWEYTFTSALGVWLKDCSSFELTIGSTFTSADFSGEIRSIDPYKRVRIALTDKNNHNTTLQLYFLPADDKTALLIEQTKLKKVEHRDTMKRYWKDILEELSVKLES